MLIFHYYSESIRTFRPENTINNQIIKFYFSPTCNGCQKIMLSDEFKKLIQKYTVEMHPIKIYPDERNLQTNVIKILKECCKNDEEFFLIKDHFFNNMKNIENIELNDPSIPNDLKYEEKLIYKIANDAGLEEEKIKTALSNNYEIINVRNVDSVPSLQIDEGAIISEDVEVKISKLANKE